MLKRWICFFMTGFLLLSLTGCMGLMEIDRISFPVALGIDYDEANHCVKAYAQISINSGTSGGSSESSSSRKLFDILEGHGDTLLDAMADITSEGSQNLSWKHITVVVITRSMARHGISSELDLICRFQQIHMNSYIMLADGDLRELLQSEPKIESSIPAPLASIRLVSEQSSQTKAITIREFLMAFLCDGKEAILPEVIVKKNEESGIVIDYSGLAFFKRDKLAGELNDNEARGAILIFGKKNISRLTIPPLKNGQEKAFAVRTIESIPEIIPDMRQSVPHITIKLKVHYDLAQTTLLTPINTAEVENMNRKVEEYVKASVEQTVHKVQKECSSDIFGFGEKIYRKYPAYWLKNKTRWDEIFPKVPVDFEVKATLKQTGELLNSTNYLDKKE